MDKPSANIVVVIHVHDRTDHRHCLLGDPACRQGVLELRHSFLDGILAEDKHIRIVSVRIRNAVDDESVFRQGVADLNHARLCVRRKLFKILVRGRAVPNVELGFFLVHDGAGELRLARTGGALVEILEKDNAFPTDLGR